MTYQDHRVASNSVLRALVWKSAHAFADSPNPRVRTHTCARQFASIRAQLNYRLLCNKHIMTKWQITWTCSYELALMLERALYKYYPQGNNRGEARFPLGFIHTLIVTSHENRYPNVRCFRDVMQCDRVTNINMYTYYKTNRWCRGGVKR